MELLLRIVCWKSGHLLLARLLILYSFVCFVGLTTAFTAKEMAAIEKLRNGVQEKLTHDFMKTDEYLMRWLTAKRMDVKQAQDMLEASLKWRKENKIDQILTEDFASFEKQYPVYKYGVDKSGRPVFGFHFGQWVVRKAAQNGQIPQLVRYAVKVLLEEPRVEAEKLMKESSVNDTRVLVLQDQSGFNLREHVCLQCFGLYTQFVSLYEKNYPEAFYKVIVVNSPSIFETIHEIIKPIMSPASKRDFLLQGVRKADWVPFVHKYVEPDQIPPQYGGNKKFTG